MTESMVWLAVLFAAWVSLGIWLLYVSLSDLIWKVALWLDQQAARRDRDAYHPRDVDHGGGGGREDDADWWKRRED